MSKNSIKYNFKCDDNWNNSINIWDFSEVQKNDML